MLFPYLIKVSLLLAVLTLGYRWLIQFESFSKLNRVLLWLNVLAAWTLPLIALPSWGPVEVQSELHHAIPKIASTIPALKQQIATIDPVILKAAAETAPPSVTITDWLMYIYLAGVAFMIAKFLFQIGGLVLVLRNSHSPRSENGITLVHDAGTRSPYSFFKWIILNPDQHSASELQNIISHETEHARQWHSLDLLLAEIQRIVLWFNPFSWFHQKLVQANLEFLADKGVLENGFEKKQYQYNLLNAVMRTNELPLTNSFAQSLLKKRIKMMNRKPSHYLAWMKYAGLIGLIYLSSAFVAPYTAQVIESLPLADVVLKNDKPVITPHPNKAKPVENEVKATPKAAFSIDSVQKTETDQPKSKWIVETNGTLYYAISPLATWEDINDIKTEVKKYGAEMNINAIEYDPLQMFITNLTVHVKMKGGASKATEGEGDFVPMKGESGYITRNHGMGTGADLPAKLATALQNDYERALAFSKEHQTDYFEYQLSKKISDQKLNSSSHSLTSMLLEGKDADSFRLKDGIGKSSDNLLKLEPEHKDAELYLDTQPATFTEVNSLPFEKVKKVNIISDGRGKKYIIVYTK